MKVTIVPAQVTTVEDRILGSLTFTQTILIVVPVFISAGIFAGLPPFMAGEIYKYILMALITTLCFTMAIRVRGQIVAQWIVVLTKYNFRPMYYVFDKNTSAYRKDYELTYEEIEPTQMANVRSNPEINDDLNVAELSRVYALIDDPNVKIRFKNSKKGGLHVHYAEIKKESI